MHMLVCAWTTGDTRFRGQHWETGLYGAKRDLGYRIYFNFKRTMWHDAKWEKSSIRLTGSTGLTGSKGAPGQKSMKGDNAERDGGAVHVRWSHDECPSTAQLVYSGRAGGSNYDQFGSGTNPQCLPLDPKNHILIRVHS